MASTKERIMDAAEKLFAEHGYDGTSLRTLTARAGVNLASVNYHFRSKEELLGCVFRRRLEQLNAERLRLLEELEAGSEGRPVPLRQLIRVLLEPPLRLAATPEAAGFGKLLGRMYSGSGGFPQKIFAGELRAFIERFSAAFARTLPGLPAPERFWRMFFSIGAMAHTLAAQELLRTVSGGMCDPLDVDTAVEMLVTFVEAGLDGPPSGAKRSLSRRRTAERRS